MFDETDVSIYVNDIDGIINLSFVFFLMLPRPPRSTPLPHPTPLPSLPLPYPPPPPPSSSSTSSSSSCLDSLGRREGGGMERKRGEDGRVDLESEREGRRVSEEEGGREEGGVQTERGRI